MGQQGPLPGDGGKTSVRGAEQMLWQKRAPGRGAKPQTGVRIQGVYGSECPGAWAAGEGVGRDRWHG